jgi:hypothetical protein
LDLFDRCDGELRRKVYWARGGEWRVNMDFGQDTVTMAIELIEDLHNRVADLARNSQPEPSKEDPDYEEHAESLREEAEAYEAMVDGDEEVEDPAVTQAWLGHGVV